MVTARDRILSKSDLIFQGSPSRMAGDERQRAMTSVLLSVASFRTGCEKYALRQGLGLSVSFSRAVRVRLPGHAFV